MTMFHNDDVPFDDYDTEIHSDEFHHGEYWDEYREWMEGEELDPEDYDGYYDYPSNDDDPAYYDEEEYPF